MPGSRFWTTILWVTACRSGICFLFISALPVSYLGGLGPAVLRSTCCSRYGGVGVSLPCRSAYLPFTHLPITAWVHFCGSCCLLPPPFHLRYHCLPPFWVSCVLPFCHLQRAGSCHPATVLEFWAVPAPAPAAPPADATPCLPGCRCLPCLDTWVPACLEVGGVGGSGFPAVLRFLLQWISPATWSAPFLCHVSGLLDWRYLPVCCTVSLLSACLRSSRVLRSDFFMTCRYCHRSAITPGCLLFCLDSTCQMPTCLPAVTVLFR